MKITDIKINDKQNFRRDIYINGNFSFTLNQGTVKHLGLKEGQEINKEEIEEIKESDVADKAYNKALKYLGYRSHSRFELKRKLKRNFPEAITESVLDQLEEDDFINDRDFAREYLEVGKKRLYSPKKIRSELNKKGVESQIINQVLEELTDEKIQEMAVKLAKKKFDRINQEKNDKAQIRKKVLGYLSRRGYRYPIAKEAAGKVLD